MKIERFFEHKGEEVYYQSTTWRPIDKQVQQINKKLRDKLLEIFPSLRKPIETEKAYTSKTKLINGNSLERVDIDILQSEDEWYYVRIIDNTGKSTSWVGNRYFTCDQFDGLVDCLKNEIYNIKLFDKDIDFYPNRKETGYEEISSSEYRSILYGDGEQFSTNSEEEQEHIKSLRQEFTESEISKIQSLFKSEIKISKKNDWTKNEIYLEWWSGGSVCGIYITKHKDEWFYIDCQIEDQILYRCDQIDGLLNILSKIAEDNNQ